MLLALFLLCVGVTAKSVELSVYKELSDCLEVICDNYHSLYAQTFHKTEQWREAPLCIEAVQRSPGQFMFLLGRMYLYDFLPATELGIVWRQYQSESKWLLAYHYIHEAAHTYQVPHAYFLLATLHHYKLTPTTALYWSINSKANLTSNHAYAQNQTQEARLPQTKQYKQFSSLIDALHKSSHLADSELYWYLGALLGSEPAKIALGFMYISGIGRQKNCSTSFAYFMSHIRKTIIENDEPRMPYYEQQSIQTSLFLKVPVKEDDFDNEHSLQKILSASFSSDSLISLGVKYINAARKGLKGIRLNYSSVCDVYEKFAEFNRTTSRLKMAYCYLDGLGRERDPAKAASILKELTREPEAVALLAVIQFYNKTAPSRKNQSIASIEKLYQQKIELPKEAQLVLAFAALHNLTNNMTSKTAKELLAKMAQKGIPQACAIIGIMATEGVLTTGFECSLSCKFLRNVAYSYPYFGQQIYMYSYAVKHKKDRFAFIKQLELSLILAKSSLERIFYLLQWGNLGLNEWSLKSALANEIQSILVQNKIVRSVQQFLRAKYSTPLITVSPNSLQQLLTSKISQKEFIIYIHKKVLLVGSGQLSDLYLKFMTATWNKKVIDYQKLTEVARGDSQQLFVLYSSFLLGRNFQHTLNDTTKAIIKYSAATGSQFLGKLIFDLELILSGSQTIWMFLEQILQTSFVQGLMVYFGMCLIVLVLVYVHRSRKQRRMLEQELERQEKQNESLPEKSENQKLHIHED